jgi:hypothetical protein
MGELTSTLANWLGRLVKFIIGLCLVPPFVGLALGIWQQLDGAMAGSKSFGEWAMRGCVAYIAVHLFVIQPKALFLAQHRMLSKLSVWLFGGQVTTEPSKGSTRSDKKSDKPEKGKSSGGPQSSTLLVLSPYLVPLYAILVCVASWALGRWASVPRLEPVTAFLVGMTVSLHWVMAADDLQQNRSRFPFDAYLLALVLIGIVSSVLVALVLPLVVAPFSIPAVFAEALRQAQAIYTAVFDKLFF